VMEATTAAAMGKALAAAGVPAADAATSHA
jgi:hypothetical protein